VVDRGHRGPRYGDPHAGRGDPWHRSLRQGITTGERQAIIDHAAHVFALGDAKYTVWQKLRCVTSHWDTIDRLLQQPGPQAATLLISRARVEVFP
jgi:hypothetical protein